MHYIITTRYRSPHATAFDRIRLRDSVATLEEAQDAALEEIGRSCEVFSQSEAEDQAQAAAIALPESGGTIGPLPDGTVIEVRWTR